MFTPIQFDLAKQICQSISSGAIHAADGVATASRAVRQLVKQWGGKAHADFDAVWNSVMAATDEATRHKAAVALRGWLAKHFKMTLEDAGMAAVATEAFAAAVEIAAEETREVAAEVAAEIQSIQNGETQDGSSNDNQRSEQQNEQLSPSGRSDGDGAVGSSGDGDEPRAGIREPDETNPTPVRVASADEIAQLAGLQENP